MAGEEDVLTPEAMATLKRIRGSRGPRGRDVIQIAGTADTLFALCADGSVWKHNKYPDPRPEWGTGEVEANWTKLPRIPEDTK